VGHGEQSAANHKDIGENIEAESMQLLEWPDVCRQVSIL
jgi:hypothetical protein